jgi:hypothetical protein
MYYTEGYFDAWLIKKSDDEMFVFGPFDSQSDAWFVCEMLNAGKIKFEGGAYGKEDTKDTHTVY